jgi:hypothetical protein
MLLRFLGAKTTNDVSDISARCLGLVTSLSLSLVNAMFRERFATRVRLASRSLCIGGSAICIEPARYQFDFALRTLSVRREDRELEAIKPPHQKLKFSLSRPHCRDCPVVHAIGILLIERVDAENDGVHN